MTATTDRTFEGSGGTVIHYRAGPESTARILPPLPQPDPAASIEVPLGDLLDFALGLAADVLGSLAAAAVAASAPPDRR